MTLLPDHEIRDELEGDDGLIVSPVDLDEQIQPASLDVRLGRNASFFDNLPGRNYIGSEGVIPDDMVEVCFGVNRPLRLSPGQFCLVNTFEWFDIPNYLAGQLTGRSSIGRMGITVHQTAGLFDPGFSGQGVMEIKNVNENRTVELEPKTRIAQMKFEWLHSPAETPYNSEDNKYQNQSQATPSKIHREP
jgi:dCTP deaminase